MNRMQEKIELLKIIGLLDSMYYDALKIDDATCFYFLPKTAIRLQHDNCNERIVDLIWACCELEDIESIIPQKLKTKIFKLKERALELLKTYEPFSGTEWI